MNPTLQPILNQASKDKFLLILDIPPFLKDVIIAGERVGVKPLELTVYGAVVPAANVPNVVNGYSGQTQHITSMHRPDYSPLTINFVIDNRFHNYYILWKWFEGLNEPQTGAYNVYTQTQRQRQLYEYQANMTIFGLDEYNKPIISFKYLHAFPTGMGGVEYSYQDAQILNSNITFQFDQLLVELLPGA